MSKPAKWEGFCLADSSLGANVTGRPMEILIDNLTIGFPTAQGISQAMRGVSMKIGREKFGIVGESGSGIVRTAGGARYPGSRQAEVLNLLMDLQERRSLTYVMVSHNLAVVAHLCASGGVMQGGEMVAIVSAADLRAGRATHPHTRELWSLSMELEEP